MTTGAGLSINPGETSPVRIVAILRQLIEGRSNAVGLVTLTHDGSSTSTTVTAVNCGPNSVVLMFPTTAHASAVVTGTYVQTTNITARQFIITHAATAQTDQTFMWVCLG
jgi:hypothetical protein